MTTFTATFRTADAWTITEIEAATPEQALQKARTLSAADMQALDWSYYDPASSDLEEIEINSPEGDAVWQSEDLALRLATPQLLDTVEAQTAAEQAVIDAWEKRDLAAAVRGLAETVVEARALIAEIR